LFDIFLPKQETSTMISGYDAPDRRELGDRATNVMMGRGALHRQARRLSEGENFLFESGVTH
jgi:hypothetical protein